MNGLYGMAPFYASSANFLDRVEVLKGPGVLLTGMPPAGGIGGSINLVTKSAPDFDITQLTTRYISKSQVGALVDVARRYGEHKEWGIRFNGGGGGGQTAFDRQTDQIGNAVLNMDYRGERVRFSADLGYQAENLSPPLRFLTFTTSPPFATTIPVPALPKPGANYMPDWASWKPRDTFAMARGEVDLTSRSQHMARLDTTRARSTTSIPRRASRTSTATGRPLPSMDATSMTIMRVRSAFALRSTPAPSTTS